MAENKTYQCIVLLTLTCLLVLASCKSESTKKTPDQLFDECASGVVLIYCEYYYSLTLPTGQTMYMAGLSEDGIPINLTSDINVIKQNCNRQFGTGFFIDSKGDIMTNRHVVDVSLDEFEVQEKIVASMRRERQTYIDSMEMARQTYAELQTKKKECYKYDYYGNIYTDNDRLQEINEVMAVVEARFDRWQQLCYFISANTNPRAININTMSKLGIAYNDTHVESEEDFFETNACVVRKVSRKENADLAIIQLKSKQTPESVYVFDVSETSMNEKEEKSIVEYVSKIFRGEIPMEMTDVKDLKMGQTLYVIGYNQGIELAQTKNGIEAQMTKGDVAQIPDGERVMYSITTIQGSSGSPVIDEDGVLRGVNFAKATDGHLGVAVHMNLIKNFLKE